MFLIGSHRLSWFPTFGAATRGSWTLLAAKGDCATPPEVALSVVQPQCEIQYCAFSSFFSTMLVFYFDISLWFIREICVLSTVGRYLVCIRFLLRPYSDQRISDSGFAAHSGDDNVTLSCHIVFSYSHLRIQPFIAYPQTWFLPKSTFQLALVLVGSRNTEQAQGKSRMLMARSSR